ncbi:uncharacterized protein LOC128188053 isoform X2 [Crassostrea angulata]|uniref:uncharacterized protein LOC128188053 isoform X2 n=1 Tax=Magallana angulata TaxID=2784310 RepID=UPI0022B14A44|nr:uncharacterized protein LOC128188053 isoform X2 [Crassostrea angulata]
MRRLNFPHSIRFNLAYIFSAWTSGSTQKIDRHPDFCRVEAFVIIFRMVLPVVIAGVLSTIGTYIGYPTVLGAVGFTEAGVSAGSIAAAVQKTRKKINALICIYN